MSNKSENLNPQRALGLDILRTFAILMVLILHSHIFFPAVSAKYPSIFFFGWAGVDLFFVLSGFLVGMQSLQIDSNQPSKIIVFWLKRWSRTLPLYFIVLAVYILVKPLFGFPFMGEKLPYLFFTQNFFKPQDFVQSWSLCIEEQFYFLLPVLCFFFFSLVRKPLFWVAVMFISVGFRAYILNVHQAISLADAAYLLQFPTHTHLDGLALGMILAIQKPNWIKWNRTKKIFCAVCGMFILTGVFSFASPSLDDTSAIWCFSALAIGFAAIVPWILEFKTSIWLEKLFTRIALWSYSLYLWNNLIFRVAEKIPLPTPAQGILAWIILFIFSMFSYRLIELPVLRWRDHLLQRQNRFL